MAFRLDIDPVEAWVSRHTRLFALLVASLVAFVGVVALAVFFVALRGAEQALVPDVRNRELAEALLELQAKELYPRIQIRSSRDGMERGLVMEQDPRPGSIVKAGRRVRLTVSQGIQVDTVEDYRGRNVSEVRMDLRALSAASRLFLSVKEPPLSGYSTESEGTILQQSPEPGAPVTGPVSLTFVVSRGPEHVSVSVPALTGLSPLEALNRLDGTGLRFGFSLRPARQGEKTGTVVHQEPDAGTALSAAQTVKILVSAAEPADGAVFRLFEYTLPENPVALQARLECLPPGSTERRLLAETAFWGGTFSFPVQVMPGSVLVFSLLNREIYRETVRPQGDPLSLDEL